MSHREAVIVSGVRTAVGKSKKGSSRNLRPEDLGAAVVQKLIADVQGKLAPEEIEDVILGCAMPEGSQGLNIARLISLQAGLPVDVPAVTVNRFCASGLQAIAQAAERVLAGGADVVLAGGVESMSLVPMTGFRMAPSPALVDARWEAYMGMGLTAERVAKEHGISRADQDAFAVRSHQRATQATDAGLFASEIVPVSVQERLADEQGNVQTIRQTLQLDEHLRRDTTVEGLGKLPAAFKLGGSVTAGNSSPLSDGAAGVLVMERSVAEKRGLTPLVRFVSFGVAGVAPEVMGIGPVKAIPRALERAGLSLAEIGRIELNEAFAAQALAVIRTLGIADEQVNVNGGAIALGHPLGCTGAKLTVQLMNELQRSGSRYGMVTMCIGGGQGAAGIFERL
ncbi:MAG TPA: acetyl-CoA C-acyltransferase [Anaerolineales bacterium]|nr:acetyl-CoA C-acyltransferase [Anaerolineales bacterium]